jgi:hypothetical protein
VRTRAVIGMNAQFKKIKALALSRRIGALTGQLQTVSLTKTPAPIKPAVNPTYNRRVHHHEAEVS